VFFPNTAAGIHGNGEGAFSGAASMEPSAVPDGISSAGQLFKRAFDVTASAILMVVFSPLAAFCSFAIWWEDGGPVIYRQERVGKGGRTFNILKFRSMRTDAEAAGAQLCSGERDPRLTRVGAFLRAYHLDELPQLWNVFKGDMSFIGYRPERPVFIRQIMEMNPRYRYLYQIRPGVTSYATLYNGYTDTLEKMLTRLDLDLYYLRNHSVLFDARVLFLTFMSIVTGKRF
jgi:lipopolysaccharide/colanic/teichoic acid biosynthesis glycosyltransferase